MVGKQTPCTTCSKTQEVLSGRDWKFGVADRGREGERERERDIYIYIYIYIHMQRKRDRESDREER